MQLKMVYLGAILSGMFLLSACDSSKQNKNADEQTSIFQKDQAEVLPYLNIKQQAADIALPFCENKNCIELEVQTLNTQDAWLNSWIAKNQAMVIQDQIPLKTKHEFAASRRCLCEKIRCLAGAIRSK